MAGKVPPTSLNVLKKPLGVFSKDPMTGFYRNGYCDVGPEDRGIHAVAAILTDPFLDFSASKGNNLRSIGLTAGCRWCLCAARWKEALVHASKSSDPASQAIVPRVHLHATHEKALDILSMDDLKKHAAEPEAATASNFVESKFSGGGAGVGLKTEGKAELAGKGGMISKDEL
ncbi:hypothetical protein BP6252_07064 [Coleophoma cylindrospora]|uniref:Uncharacterized protein n=1 Tax=Coleophoma cylindrospora TaxID=1849047 RepID=A0A3D8RGJ5_9HELO|nr:hypothetical protein BP6252_07064 [Coleophoma cylindrospora]